MPDRRVSAIELELFTHRCEAIARQMGEALRRTALAVNVNDAAASSAWVVDDTAEIFGLGPGPQAYADSLRGRASECAATGLSAVTRRDETDEYAFSGLHSALTVMLQAKAPVIASAMTDFFTMFSSPPMLEWIAIDMNSFRYE